MLTHSVSFASLLLYIFAMFSCALVIWRKIIHELAGAITIPIKGVYGLCNIWSEGGF